MNLHDPFDPDAARAAAADVAYPDRDADGWSDLYVPRYTPTPTTMPNLKIGEPVDMSWLDDTAACVGHDPDMFFPALGQDDRPAKAVCATCPLIDACREHGIKYERVGIWGGVGERQRKIIRRERRNGAPAVNGRTVGPIEHGTALGFDKHRRMPDVHGKPCAACRAAWNASQVEVKRERRARQARIREGLRSIDGGAA